MVHLNDMGGLKAYTILQPRIRFTMLTLVLFTHVKGYLFDVSITITELTLHFISITITERYILGQS